MLYTQYGKLLVVEGDLAASEGCCCQDTIVDCEYLPAEILVTLSGLPTHGHYYSYTDNTMSPVTDSAGRYVCPAFFNAWDGKTYRRFSTIDFSPGNGTWLAVGEKAAFGWQWVNSSIPSPSYEAVANTPPATGYRIVTDIRGGLRLVVLIEDCAIGPGDFDIEVQLSGANLPYNGYVVANWTKTVTLAVGETLLDHMPITLDPEAVVWGGYVAGTGALAADFGSPDCSGFVPFVPGTPFSSYPGCVLDV